MAKRILLSSVFKPFGVDTPHSRADSKIELYHNQLTKYQGVFSMRAFMNTYGLHAIANNIETPTTVLEFPTLKRFRREIKKGYDIIGIGSIMPNFQKVKMMVEEIRETSPRSTIVVGGFCATIPDIKEILDVDHVCVGEGISFMRDLLGLPTEFKYKNPNIYAASKEIFGVPLYGIKNPHIVVGLGCSYGCEFCSPSHFFGRRHLKFFEDGEELFHEMIRVEKVYGSNQICFIGDDNFLLERKRAQQLREKVIESGHVFNAMFFASADRILELGPEQLAEMGVGMVWIGREGKHFAHRKTKGTSIKDLVAELRRYGVKTILSSILLLPEHTRDNIMEDVEEHIECNPAFSQFSHYSPVPGTPLYDRLEEENRILKSIPLEEWHAFKQPWFYHPEFNLVEAEKIQEQAYMKDFLELGPSLLRYFAADLEGWQTLRKSDKPHLRKRADWLASEMWKYRAMLLAIQRLAPTDHVSELARDVRERIEAAHGKTTLLEKSIALGLTAAGKARQARTARWGDALQPATFTVKYNQ